jgi:hypothetical protein
MPESAAPLLGSSLVWINLCRGPSGGTPITGRLFGLLGRCHMSFLYATKLIAGLFIPSPNVCVILEMTARMSPKKEAAN